MAKKNDLTKIMDKYGPMLKKFGNDAGKAAKKGEESLVHMSRVLKLHIDMMGVSLQREKLYYDIGKEVAEKLMKNDVIEIQGFSKYKKQLEKLQAEGAKKKKEISKVQKKTAKKKTKKTKKS